MNEAGKMPALQKAICAIRSELKTQNLKLKTQNDLNQHSIEGIYIRDAENISIALDQSFLF